MHHPYNYIELYFLENLRYLQYEISSGPCWNCAQGAGAPGRHLGIQDGRQYTSGRHLGLDGDRKCTGGHLGFQDGGQGHLAPWAQFQQSDFFCLFIPYLLSSLKVYVLYYATFLTCCTTQCPSWKEPDFLKKQTSVPLGPFSFPDSIIEIAELIWYGNDPRLLTLEWVKPYDLPLACPAITWT